MIAIFDNHCVCHNSRTIDFLQASRPFLQLFFHPREKCRRKAEKIYSRVEIENIYNVLYVRTGHTVLPGGPKSLVPSALRGAERVFE